MDLHVFAEQAIEKLKIFYSEKYIFKYNIDVDGAVVPIMASMHDRQQKSMLGMQMKGLGPEASEHIFFLTEETFNTDVMAKLDGIIKYAESEFVQPGPDHAFTFLSVVLFAGRIEADALKVLKKYKSRKNYRENGWSLSRVVVLSDDKTAESNKDGVDLKRMLLKVIIS